MAAPTAQAMPAQNMAQNPAAAPAQAPVASLYVGDLSTDPANPVTEKELHEVFKECGTLASIRVCRDSVTRKSLGYAYVNYLSSKDAEEALKQKNYTEINGKQCRIMWSHRDPSLRKNAANSNVFVKNLDKKIDNKALFETFSLFGGILSCKVATDDKGRSLGYGFVHYMDEDAAKQAIERVNNMQIGEKTVFVGPFCPRTERPDAPESDKIFTNLYVKNFPAEWEEAQVSELFKNFGTITSTYVATDPKQRKFAFVNMETPEMAKKAVETLHNKKDYRTEEEKNEYESEMARREAEQLPPVEEGLLYVGRAQTKRERVKNLKAQYATNTAPGAYTEPEHIGTNLYIKNLDDSVDDEQLKSLFLEYGEVGSACVMRDEKGKSRGFGFVSLLDKEQANKAIADNHLKVVCGKPLYVGLAEKRGERQSRLNAKFRNPGMQQQGYMGNQMGGNPMYYSGNRGGMPGQMMGGMNPNWRGPQGQMGMNPMMMGQMGMGGQMGGMGARPGQYPNMGMQQNMPYNMQQNMYRGNPGMMNQQRGPAGAMNRGPQGQNMGMQNRGQPQFTNQARNQGSFNQQRPMQTMQPPQGQQPPRQQGQFDASGPLTAASLAAAPPGMQKQMLGEKLFPAVAKHQPELAGKITGMMLEMDNSELLMLLESDAQMKCKIDEAMKVIGQAR